MLHNAILLVLMLGFSTAAISAEVIMRAIPNAQPVGEARLTFAFWDVYDATLYAPQGKLGKNMPFALYIHYLREIDGSDIADQSLQEMREQGFTDEGKLAAWETQMKKIFPNVDNGTVLSAIFIPGQKTIFYQETKQIGVIKDAEFTQKFADIWLGENTSEPALRRKLLGLP